MRIAISGKGGSGKTTLAGTLARIYARQEHRVPAIDGDPNPNLAVTPAIVKADRTGVSLFDYNPDAPFVMAVRELAARLEELD